MITTLALPFAAAALAHDTDPDVLRSAFSYDYIDVSYVAREYDLIDETGSGIAVRASYDLAPYMNLIGVYSYDTIDLTLADIDTSGFAFGIGSHFPVHERVDVYSEALFLYGDRKGGGVDRSETGFGLEAGLRTMPIDRLEFDAAFNYTDLFESDTNLVLGARAYVTRAASIRFRAQLDDDGDIYALGLRYQW